MSGKVAKKTSLIAGVRECFFGFADGADEKTFVRLQIQLRLRGLILFFVIALARSFHLILTSEDFLSNPLGSILLEPGCPVPSFFFLLLLLNGKLQWVEPSAFIFAAFRYVCDTG
eukprot:gene27997-8872_t